MRLKNVKNAKNIIEHSKYVINNPEKNKGRYNNINLEIGMGKGDFIIEMAKQNKNTKYVGIEMFDSVLVRAVQKLDEEDIPNLKLIRYDATDIEKLFKQEVNTIYLNFSDPWPKKRHEHRRLTSERFLKRYENIFKDEAHIIMKTDNRKLFEYSLVSFINNNYLIKNISLDLHNDKVDNIETEYEKKYVKEGKPIYMVEVYKTLHVK